MILSDGMTYGHRAVANFPSTIYQFYTGDGVSGFLNDVGFSRIQILNQRIGSRVFTLGVAHRMPSSWGGSTVYVRRSLTRVSSYVSPRERKPHCF
jgi:hypothetical protein